MSPAETLTLTFLPNSRPTPLRGSHNPSRSIVAARCSRSPIGKSTAPPDPIPSLLSPSPHLSSDRGFASPTPEAAVKLFREFRAEGTLLNPEITSKVMLWHAQNGNFLDARELWDEIVYSNFKPGLDLITRLMEAYGRMQRPDEAFRILQEVASREFGFGRELFSLAVMCFGKSGELVLMERVLKEMARRGFKVDSLTANNVVKYYGKFGTLAEIELACERLKQWRVLIEEDAIRVVSRAYIREGKMYRLGEFLRGIGLGRRNVGNLLWNLLLLSYAVNFKMKSLQREFLGMVGAGFPPDLTTFNIRLLAFSRMNMFWDLHLSIEHMKHMGVVPDLVTYGCIVDVYLDRRLGKNLSFALDKMAGDVDDVPHVATDPIVFEAFGKGDFHIFSEELLESKRRIWTYGRLIKTYLKRAYRSDQIFWNY